VTAAARSRKGDRFLAQAKASEARKEWDASLELAEKALGEDPSDPSYQLEVHHVRFQAAEFHITQGLKLRKEGSLAPALMQFEKAYGIDPSSNVAEQEIKTTAR